MQTFSSEYIAISKSVMNKWIDRGLSKEKMHSGENTVISDEVTITVSNTVITKQPESRTGCEGDEVTWTISAKGENLSYQWQYSADGGKTWNNFGGATTAKLTRTLKSIWNGWKVRCAIKDSGENTVISDEVTITVIQFCRIYISSFIKEFRQLCKDIFKVIIRSQIIQLCGFRNTIYHCAGRGSFCSIVEHPVFLAKAKGTYSSL